MRIVCTVCSRVKRTDEGLLPAYERYLGDHIKPVQEIAEKERVLFFILSGKYGLIPAEQKIPDYDYYLEEEKIHDLASLISDQIKERGITEIDYYGENKESRKPYNEAIREATDIAGATFRFHEF